MLFGAVCTFMKRDLNRIKGYFEVTVPTYFPSEFQSHFRMTITTFEILCREIVQTAKIPTGNLKYDNCKLTSRFAARMMQEGF